MVNSTKYNYTVWSAIMDIEGLNQIKKLTCKRCGYTWWPKSPKKPITCANPKCRSPYWNKLRVRTEANLDNNRNN